MRRRTREFRVLLKKPHIYLGDIWIDFDVTFIVKYNTGYVIKGFARSDFCADTLIYNLRENKSYIATEFAAWSCVAVCVWSYILIGRVCIIISFTDWKANKYRVTKRLEPSPYTNWRSIDAAHTRTGCHGGHINYSDLKLSRANRAHQHKRTRGSHTTPHHSTDHLLWDFAKTMASERTTPILAGTTVQTESLVIVINVLGETKWA